MNTWDSLSRQVKDKSTGAIKSTDARPVRDVYAQGMMAPQYSALTFPVMSGAHCIYEGELYAAKQDIAASEAWTAAHWDKVQLGAEVAKVGAFVADLKSHLSETERDSEAVTYTVSVGYVTPDGTIFSDYTGYRYTNKIQVMAGDKITATVIGSGTMRVVTAFSGETAVSASGAENVTDYTVPSGIDSIIVTYSKSSVIGLTREYETIVVKGMPEMNTRVTALENASGKKTPPIYRFNIDGSNKNYTTTDNMQDMNNYVIQFSAQIDTFNDVIIGHGYNAYMTGHVVVDITNFSYYLGAEASPRYTAPHGLTFSDYIIVRIDTRDRTKTAKFSVETNGGTFTYEGTWDVRKGALQVKTTGTNVLSNCILSYYDTKWLADTWIFGDSYIGPYTDKWTSYLYAADMKNNLWNGFPGRTTLEAKDALVVALKYATPKRIIWALGMNNSDSSDTISVGWKNNTEAVMEICANEGIELILATIPNVETVINIYKNSYVIDHSADYRYIDFASAVGALNDSTWYSGMLSNDGVHPSVQGAIALFNQAIADVPELMQ